MRKPLASLSQFILSRQHTIVHTIIKQTYLSSSFSSPLFSFFSNNHPGVKTSLRESDDNLGPLLDRKGLSQKSGKPAMMDDDDDDDDEKEEQVEEDDDDDDDDDEEEDLATFMRESNNDLKKLKKLKKAESKSLGKGKSQGKVAYNDFDETYEDNEENHFGGDFGEGDPTRPYSTLPHLES